MGSAPSTPVRSTGGHASRSSTVTRPVPATSEASAPEEINEKHFARLGLSSSGPSVVSSRDSTHVSASRTQDWVTKVLASPKNRLALSALSTADPASVLTNPAIPTRDTQTFNLSIPHEGGPVTNQRSSGRCWIFAATNVFRVAIMNAYDLPAFELSQSYLFFWDKVEKANWFLEEMLACAETEDVDGRLVMALNASPVGDGGQWDMLANLVRKYGLVPQKLYPDSWSAMNSRRMDSLLTTKLREDGLRLRKLVRESIEEEEIAAAKDAMMQEVVRILTLTLGPPPKSDEKFTWDYYDKQSKFHSLRVSPLEFAAGLKDGKALRACGGTDVHNLLSLVNDPRNDYGQLLTVDHLGNVRGGQPVTYVNVEMHELKSAAIAMIKKGFPVFFGSDVGKYSDSKTGVMDVDLVDYELGFDVKLGMSKAQRLETGESAMTHAMVLTAVHLSAEGKPVRWRVENSWSKDVGDQGYFVASDAWMDQFCYQVVVDSRVLGSDITDILKQKPKHLPLWDPMGALAG